MDRDGFIEEAGQELVWVTMEKFLQKERDWQGLWGLDQLHWSRVSQTKSRWNQGNIVYFQKQKWDCKFQWQGLEYKLISFGGGADRKRNGSGESDGTNLGRMRSSSSLNKSVMEREDASGDSGSEFEEFWWRIACVDGFSGCARIGIWFSYRIVKKDSALEMRDLTELHSARNFARSKEDFQRANIA